MSSNNKYLKMGNKFLNFAFPVGGGSAGAVLSTITWGAIGEMVLQAALFAFVGGLVGWIVKRVLDKVFKKK